MLALVKNIKGPILNWPELGTLFIGEVKTLGKTLLKLTYFLALAGGLSLKAIIKYLFLAEENSPLEKYKVAPPEYGQFTKGLF